MIPYKENVKHFYPTAFCKFVKIEGEKPLKGYLIAQTMGDNLSIIVSTARGAWIDAYYRVCKEETPATVFILEQ